MDAATVTLLLCVVTPMACLLSAAIVVWTSSTAFRVETPRRSHPLNVAADVGAFRRITRRISRGTGGWERAAVRSLTIVLALLIGVELLVAVAHPLGSLRQWGGDYGLYMDAARRWLGGGPFYQPWQLEPYVISFVPGDIGTTAILYPPYTLALFVPFTFLPAALWWAIPIGVIGYCLYPLSGWRLVALLAALLFPITWFVVANGNPALWAAAAVVAGNRWRWLGVFVALKPTLVPFAVVGIRSAKWWVGAAGIAILSLVLWQLTLEYVAVILNADGPHASPLYSVGEYLPIGLLWFASRRQRLDDNWVWWRRVRSAEIKPSRVAAVGRLPRLERQATAAREVEGPPSPHPTASDCATTSGSRSQRDPRGTRKDRPGRS